MNYKLAPGQMFIQKTKIGTCPHGLPAGACPICSGMGGGGGSSRKTTKAAGEMSWDECVAVGQMLKAQRLAQQKRDMAMQAQLPLKRYACAMVASMLLLGTGAATGAEDMPRYMQPIIGRTKASPTAKS